MLLIHLNSFLNQSRNNLKKINKDSNRLIILLEKLGRQINYEILTIQNKTLVIMDGLIIK